MSYELIAIHVNPPIAPKPFDAHWKSEGIRVSGSTKIELFGDASRGEADVLQSSSLDHRDW